MESDIRAKAPPGPSLAPVPGPFPEMPGRGKRVRGWFGALVHPSPKDLGRKRQNVGDAQHPKAPPREGSSALPYLCAS